MVALFILLNMPELTPRRFPIGIEAALGNHQLNPFKARSLEHIRDFGFPDGIAYDGRLGTAETDALNMRTAGNHATHHMKPGIREYQPLQNGMPGKGFLLYLIHLIGHALISHRLGNLDAGILLVDGLHRYNTASPGSTQEIACLELGYHIIDGFGLVHLIIYSTSGDAHQQQPQNYPECYQGAVEKQNVIAQGSYIRIASFEGTETAPDGKSAGQAELQLIQDDAQTVDVVAHMVGPPRCCSGEIYPSVPAGDFNMA